MNNPQVWTAALVSLTRMRDGATGMENDALMVKGLLAFGGVSLLVWGLALLREARQQAGAGSGWQAFREWGGPVTLIVAALILICVSDGGRIDRFLARMHWRLLERLDVLPAPAGSGQGDPGAMTGKSVGEIRS